MGGGLSRAAYREKAREAYVKEELRAAIQAGSVCGYRKLRMQIPSNITYGELQRHLPPLLPHANGWPRVEQVMREHTLGESEEAISHIIVYIPP
jgi:murein L,D-transpeptidase YcbB/YkuD